MSHILETTLNPPSAKGFEGFSFGGLTIMSFALRQVTKGGQATYTPVRTGV
jgi:hypothetical protein